MSHSYTPPVQQFLNLAKENPKKIYLSQAQADQWIEYTRQEVLEKAQKMAGYLKSLGLQPGDKVALYSKNCAHWIISDLAIWMGGFVSVPVYPNLNQETVTNIISHSDSKALLVGHVVGWDKVKPLLPQGLNLIALPEGGPSDLPQLNKVIEDHALDQISLPANEDLATIIYTSGTTGNPKGVMHSFLSFSSAGSEGVPWLNLDQNSKFFSFLPLSHVAERVSVETQCLYSGGCIYFCESLDTFAKNVTDIQPTLFFSVPRLWLKFYEKITKQIPEKKLNLYLKIPIFSSMIKNKIVKGLGLSDAKHIVTGSAATPAHLFLFFDKLGIKLQEAYGMTENFAYSHLSLNEFVKLGSVGIPYPGVDVKVGDNDEVLIKSPANMIGYYKNEEATSDAFTEDGYLKTGDQGKIDDKGFLYITGRVKELFKTSKGKYVRPTPIEEKFIKENIFEQVCVMGDGFPQPFAVVKLHPHVDTDNSNIQKSIQKINQSLDAHERISKVAIIGESWTVENGFLTPTLKVKRAIVEKHYSPNFDDWMNKKDKVVYHS